jgi:hypothetical protein
VPPAGKMPALPGAHAATHGRHHFRPHPAHWFSLDFVYWNLRFFWDLGFWDFFDLGFSNLNFTLRILHSSFRLPHDSHRH